MPNVPWTRAWRACAVPVALAACASVARASCGVLGPAAFFAANASPQAVATADFDRDGIADLAVAHLTGATLTVLRGTGGGAFAAPVAWASGTSGRALTIADFNADGAPDVAVALSNGVAVWLGDGHGAVSGGAIVAAGSSLRGIVAEDFDRDGITDLAVSSSGTNQVLVLRGRGTDGLGDGTFSAPEAYTVGASPARVRAADVTGDGIADLVVADNSGASVSVLAGHGAGGVGDGTFAPAVSFAVAGSPWDVAALDWSGDGIADLVVSNGAGTSVALLRGTGGGGFVAAGAVTTPLAPRDLAVGDFDGDGIADVATACAAGNVVVVMRGTGATLVAGPSFAAGSGSSGLVAGDWNGDGAPDLACAVTGGSVVGRWLGACGAPAGAGVTLLSPRGGESWWPGTVQQARWTRGAGVPAVDVDLSRDGGATWLSLARGLAADRLAVPAVGRPDPRLRLRVRDAVVPARADATPADFTLCGLLGDPIASDAGFAPSRLAAADLDGDGAPDLVAADAARVTVLRGDGHGRFAATATFPSDSTRVLALADTDGDGLLDLVRLAPGALAVRPGDGRGGFGPERRVTAPGATGLATGDFDGDGTADAAVLEADPAGARLAILRAAAGSPAWSVAMAGAPGAIVATDLDGDGRTDLAAAAGTTVGFWLSRGDGTFGAGASRSLPVAPGDLLGGDLDGDGRADLVACLPPTGDLLTLSAPAASDAMSTAAAAPAVVTAAGAGPATPAIADLDGDGHADLVLALAGEGNVAVMPGGGGAVVRFPAAATALVVDDFTGDGLPDAVVAGADGTIRCLPATCPPRLDASVALAPASAADTAGALAGFARRIAWTRGPAVPSVRVELSRDAGVHWIPLAGAVTGGTFDWIAGGPPGAAMRLRVRDTSCGTRAEAGAVFTLRAPFVTCTTQVGAPGAVAFAAGDADGDGTPDVLVATADSLALRAGDGAAGFASGPRWPCDRARRVAIADLDGDGTTDLVALHDAALDVAFGDGAGAFRLPETVPLDAGCADLAVADLDGDGAPDLVTACGAGPSCRVAVRRGLGGGTFAPPWNVALAATPSALALGDLDGDGITDVVVTSGGALVALLGNGTAGRGTGTFRTASSRAFVSPPPRRLQLADLDGDGRLDAFAADSAGGTLRVALGDGHGGFGPPLALACPGAPVAVEAADVDHDGATDLLAALSDGSLALVRGVPGAVGAARFAPARRAGDGAAAALALADADGDGSADLVTLDAAGTLRVLHAAAPPAGPPRLLGAPSAASVGARVPIAWNAPAGVDVVDVQLSRDGGARWQTIAPAVPGRAWTWFASGPATGAARLRVRDARVPSACDSASASFVLSPSTTAAGEPDAGGSLRLGSPWPNPSRGVVRVELELPRGGVMHVDVTDVAGRRVRTLLAATLPAGRHALAWDGADDGGHPLPAGLYFVRARTGGFTATRRVARTR